jgi:hypothetical protein
MIYTTETQTTLDKCEHRRRKQQCKDLSCEQDKVLKSLLWCQSRSRSQFDVEKLLFSIDFCFRVRWSFEDEEESLTMECQMLPRKTIEETSFLSDRRDQFLHTAHSNWVRLKCSSSATISSWKSKQQVFKMSSSKISSSIDGKYSSPVSSHSLSSRQSTQFVELVHHGPCSTLSFLVLTDCRLSLLALANPNLKAIPFDTEWF